VQKPCNTFVGVVAEDIYGGDLKVLVYWDISKCSGQFSDMAIYGKYILGGLTFINCPFL